MKKAGRCHTLHSGYVAFLEGGGAGPGTEPRCTPWKNPRASAGPRHAKLDDCYEKEADKSAPIVSWRTMCPTIPPSRGLSRRKAEIDRPVAML